MESIILFITVLTAGVVLYYMADLIPMAFRSLKKKRQQKEGAPEVDEPVLDPIEAKRGIATVRLRYNLEVNFNRLHDEIAFFFFLVVELDRGAGAHPQPRQRGPPRADGAADEDLVGQGRRTELDDDRGSHRQRGSRRTEQATIRKFLLVVLLKLGVCAKANL